MRALNMTTAPAIATLSLEFGLFDRWFCSLPGPTQPNRLFYETATSYGTISNVVDEMVNGFPQRTIFDDILDGGFDWRVYYGDFPASLELSRLRDHPLKFEEYSAFLYAAKHGELPTFSYIEPRWFNFLEWYENDQHPPKSVAQGEFLIKEVSLLFFLAFFFFDFISIRLMKLFVLLLFGMKLFL